MLLFLKRNSKKQHGGWQHDTTYRHPVRANSLYSQIYLRMITTMIMMVICSIEHILADHDLRDTPISLVFTLVCTTHPDVNGGFLFTEPPCDPAQGFSLHSA